MGNKRTAASKKRKNDEAGSSTLPYENEPLTSFYNMASEIGNFGSRSRFDEFKRLMNGRKVLRERVFPADILAQVHFPYLAQFREWDWMGLIENTSTVVLSDVVKSFYFNAVPKPDHFESSFHGIVYKIYRRDIAKAIGSRIKPGNGVHKAPNNYPMVDACKRIWGDNRINRMRSKLKDIPLEHRILHLIVAQAIRPKQGGFDRIDPIEIFLMDKIIRSEPFDLVEFIVSFILHGISTCSSTLNTYSLPYGKLLTHIIKKKIRGINENDVSDPWKIGAFSLATVHQMGWRLDSRTNTWRRKEEIEREAQMEAADEDFNPQDDEIEEDDAEEEDAEEEQGEEGQRAAADDGIHRAELANRLSGFMLSQENFIDHRVNNIEDQMLTRFERLSMENAYITMQNDYQIALLHSMRNPDQAPPAPLGPPPEYPPLVYSNRYSPEPNPYFYPDPFHPNSPPYNPDA